MAIGRSLGIDDIVDMERHQSKLDKVIEWAKLRGAESTDDYIAELAGLRNRIGNPTIFDLNVYLSIEMERMQTAEAKQMLDEKEKKLDGKLRKFEKRDEKGRYL